MGVNADDGLEDREELVILGQGVWSWRDQGCCTDGELRFGGLGREEGE